MSNPRIETVRPEDILGYLSKRKLDGATWAVIIATPSQSPSRGDVDAVFSVACTQMEGQFHEPDYPPKAQERDYLGSLNLTGSRVAVWDFDYYLLSLSFETQEHGEPRVVLRGHAPG